MGGAAFLFRDGGLPVLSVDVEGIGSPSWDSWDSESSVASSGVSVASGLP